MTEVLNTEDGLQAALDTDPGNHLLRYALADCLEESAGTETCAVCGGVGRMDEKNYHGAWDSWSCNRCSGTGRVSDGRRERAEGYRVLAQLGRVPWKGLTTGGWFYSNWTLSSDALPNSGPDRSQLAVKWLAAIGVVEDSLSGSGRTRSFRTRREAEDAAALAWDTLPAETRAKILGAAK